ncbi:MAG: hypothetical protein O2856_07370 [Planctomycetota bacterium]|nr:hypothetical protein [Planctomycetota bacterium]
MRILCLMLLTVLAVGCGGGSGDPVPSANPTPPPGTDALEGAGMDEGGKTTGETTKSLGTN